MLLALLIIAKVAQIPFLVIYMLHLTGNFISVLIRIWEGDFLKKLFKVIVFIFIFNLIRLSSLFGWVAYSVIVPSLAGTADHRYGFNLQQEH